jgi:superfamily II DNA or RNA helicase
MKAVLSNRIYMEVTTEYRKWLNEELTYTIPTYNPMDPPLLIKNMARIRDNLVSLPIGCMKYIPEDYEVIDKRLTHAVDFPEFTFTLRQSQQDIYNAVEDSCIINAHPSWGKTFTGLAIASKLGQKTLVVTHTVNLRNQWAREVEKVTGYTPGIIGSGNLDIDNPIVIGNTQTLYRNIPLIKKEFGTLILDEMHHVSAPSFSRIVDTNFARYKIGLSATLQRKDGKHVVFRDYFGDTIYKPPKENMMTPSVDIIRTNIKFQDGAKTPWANRVTNLTSGEEYRHLVSILAATYAAKGYKVLVVADRTAFLKTCAELVGDKAVCVVGEVDQSDRDRLQDQILHGEKQVLFGTQAIYSEGISIDSLSCLILATPLNNDPLLEQLVGRICRVMEGKLNPIVVDLHLLGNTARRQASARMGFYMRQGYHIREITN